MDQRSSAPRNGGGAIKRNSGNGLAVASLVLGIIGFLCIILGVFNILICLLAIIFGIAALVKKQKKGLGITGLVLGSFGLIGSTLVSIIFGFVFTHMILGQEIEYDDSPIVYCFLFPDESECKAKKATTIKPVGENTKLGESCSENINGANCIKDSPEYWEAYCESHPTYFKCVKEDVDTGWVKEFLKNELKSDGDEDAEVPDELVSVAIDFVTCLNDAGFKVESYDDLSKILNNLDTEEEKYTKKQLTNGEKCADNFTKDLDNFTANY